MLEALALKISYSTAERHREGLRDLEEFFGLEGLLAGSDKITHKRHNSKVHQALEKLQVKPPPGLAGLQIVLNWRCTVCHAVLQIARADDSKYIQHHKSSLCYYTDSIFIKIVILC